MLVLIPSSCPRCVCLLEASFYWLGCFLIYRLYFMLCCSCWQSIFFPQIMVFGGASVTFILLAVLLGPLPWLALCLPTLKETFCTKRKAGKQWFLFSPARIQHTGPSPSGAHLAKLYLLGCCSECCWSGGIKPRRRDHSAPNQPFVGQKS